MTKTQTKAINLCQNTACTEYSEKLITIPAHPLHLVAHRISVIFLIPGKQRTNVDRAIKHTFSPVEQCKVRNTYIHKYNTDKLGINLYDFCNSVT